MNKINFFFFLFPVFIIATLAFAQSQYNSCQSCTPNAGVGWCGTSVTSGSCISGSGTTAPSTCQSPNQWSWYTSDCTRLYGATPTSTTTTTSTTTSGSSCGTSNNPCVLTCGQTLTNQQTTDKIYYILSGTPPSQVTITMTPSQTADYDLYQKSGTPPTLTDYTCRPYLGIGATETCTASISASFNTYAMVNYYSGRGGYTISAQCISTFPSTTTTTSISTQATSYNIIGAKMITLEQNSPVNLIVSGGTYQVTLNSVSGTTYIPYYTIKFNGVTIVNSQNLVLGSYLMFFPPNDFLTTLSNGATFSALLIQPLNALASQESLVYVTEYPLIWGGGTQTTTIAVPAETINLPPGVRTR